MPTDLKERLKQIVIDKARREIAAQQEKAMAAARRGSKCPECGETADIEDNGAEGVEHAFRCGVCGCQWDMTIGLDR